jgi:TalC/MipB family fructose-6-phosphate aldolase
MQFMFDSANIGDIKKYGEYFPVCGVTSNPSILKAEGHVEFFAHFREIRSIIGFDKTLHVQVIAEAYDGILKDAEAVLKNIDDKVYIKIPTTEEGLKAMIALKKNGVHITATAIYSKIQGFMAIAAGADFIAPYFNRMENIDIDPADTIEALAHMIAVNNSATKIVAASFKNIAQVNVALRAGAHTVTVPPVLLHQAFGMAAIQQAVDGFKADWVSTQGDVFLANLPREGF